MLFHDVRDISAAAGHEGRNELTMLLDDLRFSLLG
jgi:hypothetical protein